MAPTSLPPTTRRRFLAVSGATLVAAALPSLPATAAAATPSGRPPLSPAHRRTVWALLEADLPADTSDARLGDGVSAIDERYDRSSSAGRAHLRRLVEVVEDSPSGRRGFSRLSRLERRNLLRDLGADDERPPVERPVADAIRRLVESGRDTVAPVGTAREEIVDFAATAAGKAPPVEAWEARAADRGHALRADVRSALLLVRSALESLDHLDEF